MRHSLVRVAAACALSVVFACRREVPPARPPLTAQTTGTIVVAGLSAPVRVTRDRWGVPHIYAASRDDLFIAQGFVQAQDRLFQMDLWRRAAQGRLSAVLGPNFIERDAMTRRMQFRGDLAAEWASYGAEARAIAAAFVQGVNAWVALARARPPEPFVLAGWRPDLWEPADLLNRTEAFVESGDAIEEVARRHLSEVVADAIRRVGTPPFFSILAGPVRGIARSGDGASRDRELLSPLASAPASRSHAAARDGVVDVAEAPRRFEAPSRRYIVHLVAPGWNVIGLTAPWRPGVAVGHNERLAWGAEPIVADTQEIAVVPMDAPGESAATRVVQDAIAVKGRREPFSYDTTLTADGVVVATDREHRQNFALRWTGFAPGAAAEMASPAIDVATTAQEFQAAVARWRMPPRRFEVVEADAVTSSPPRGTRGTPRTERKESSASSVVKPSSSVSSVVDLFSGERTVTRALFPHVLGVTEAAAARFTIGPLPRPVGGDQPVRARLDSRSWDASRAMNAPGQSESPDSAHFADLARLWSAGETFPLVYTAAAVDANAEATLTLVPMPPRR